MFDRVRRFLKRRRNLEESRDTILGLDQLAQRKGDEAFISALMFPTSATDTENRHIKPLMRMNTQTTAVGVTGKTPRLADKTRKLGEVINNKSDNSNQWNISLEFLLSDKHGVRIFRRFLQSEFSEENIDFWIACERFKQTKKLSKLKRRALKIYTNYIDQESPKQINIDSYTRSMIEEKISVPTTDMFDKAQKRVQLLMENGSYTRFLQSEIYNQTRPSTQTCDKYRISKH